MQDVAGTIFEGAVAFIRRQYTTIGILAVVGAVVIGARHRARSRRRTSPTRRSSALDLGWRTGLAFLVGAACSMASGIIGMYISVKSNLRTAAAARRSLVEAVQVAMRGGAVSGFLVVALSLLGVYGIFAALRRLHGGQATHDAPFLIVGFGFGASFVALFAQLGGGIYTKAADVGLGPRRQGRGGHPRGRSAQRGRHRGPRRRQRRRLRRPRRRPVRVDRRREHRRDDPRASAVFTIALAAGWPNPAGLDLLPARRPRLRPAGHDRRDLLRPRAGGREPDEHAQPRLLGHHDPVRRSACSSRRTSC